MDLQEFTVKIIESLVGYRNRYDLTHGKFEIDGTKLRIVTGGWADNEEIVGEMMNQIAISMFWDSSHRGGLHVFDFKDSAIGSQIVKALSN